jgi:hypothetical protein
MRCVAEEMAGGGEYSGSYDGTRMYTHVDLYQEHKVFLKVVQKYIHIVRNTLFVAGNSEHTVASASTDGRTGDSNGRRMNAYHSTIQPYYERTYE